MGGGGRGVFERVIRAYVINIHILIATLPRVWGKIFFLFDRARRTRTRGRHMEEGGHTQRKET